VLYVKVLEVTGAVRACNYTDRTRHLTLGDIVFCNSNDDDSTIGVVTAAFLDDLFIALMPTQHTQTFSLSDLSLAEEIVDTDS